MSLGAISALMGAAGPDYGGTAAKRRRQVLFVLLLVFSVSSFLWFRDSG